MNLDTTTRYLAAVALILAGCSAPDTATADDPAPPQVCLDAIDDASELVDIHAKASNHTGTVLVPMIAEAFDAGLARDQAAIEDLTVRAREATAEIERRTARIEANTFSENAIACRELAE